MQRTRQITADKVCKVRILQNWCHHKGIQWQKGHSLGGGGDGMENI
jgi:hypothetical protein